MQQPCLGLTEDSRTNDSGQFWAGLLCSSPALVSQKIQEPLTQGGFGSKGLMVEYLLCSSPALVWQKIQEPITQGSFGQSRVNGWISARIWISHITIHIGKNQNIIYFYVSKFTQLIVTKKSLGGAPGLGLGCRLFNRAWGQVICLWLWGDTSDSWIFCESKSHEGTCLYLY